MGFLLSVQIVLVFVFLEKIRALAKIAKAPIFDQITSDSIPDYA
jgi:hypothetical protein